MSDRARAGTVKHITSTQNPVIKAAKALQQRKARAESGLFLAEGHKLIVDALDEGWPPEMIIALEPKSDEEGVTKLAARVRAQGGDVIFTNIPVMEKLARRDNPQTVIGVFEQRFAPLETMTKGTVVALEGPRDPGNVGTIIRTADAVGASGLILIGAATDPFGVETVRATMGSIFHVPIARTDLARFSSFAVDFPGRIVGTHLNGTVDLRDVPAAEPQMLLMGTEQSGLTEAAASVCDPLVKIAMAGKADSLNLAVATAVALYELRRPFLP
ncbi:TrmH family RNA methyltransferase [Acuticoccus mangrovi]|uniref:RNA methyltransferase n=1 Tax=Acuticoccus mangrovi TaxID=2796142 RepID=A0A934IQS8_9HYPH|nr:RNA methyltransferase [Acuticoccus mangrovi]MBJ3775899.1 RNA methyltransferase [Acuticoccus mangrovi]